MKGIHLIAAIGEDGAIGKNGDLIWKVSEDLKRFKSLTTGHPVIMGRKTWESLPKKPLPNRRNIILTRQKNLRVEGAEIADSVEDAMKICGGEEPFVIGGAEIYNAFLPYITVLDLTMVKAKCEDADAFLNIDFSSGWDMTEESEIKSTPEGILYQYKTFRRSQLL